MGSQGGPYGPMGSQDPWGFWVPMGSQGSPYGVPGYGTLGILVPDGIPGHGSLGILGPDVIPGDPWCPLPGGASSMVPLPPPGLTNISLPYKLVKQCGPQHKS